MARLKSWVIQVCQWLWRPKLLWLGLIVILLFFGIPYLFFKTEQCFRHSGLLLQLFGIITVFIGMLDTRAQFKQPKIFAVIDLWRKDFPTWSGKRIIGMSTGVLAISGGRARVEIWANCPENPNLNDKVATI